MYKCKIICDSLSPQGDRLTTFLVTYPRIIHAQMCRHRMFSRNTASSRAIPFKKIVKDVQENPFIPKKKKKDHKGMQGTEYFTEKDFIEGKRYLTAPKINNSDWLHARDQAVKWACELNRNSTTKQLSKATSIFRIDELQGTGVTKQLCKRLLEPFMWVTELITTGEEGLINFFIQRCPQYGNNEQGYYRSKKDVCQYKNKQLLNYGHEEGHNTYTPENYFNNPIDWFNVNKSQADIHIQAIAEMMWDSYIESTPKQLKAGEWHIPFGDNFDVDKLAEAVTKVGISNTSHNEFVESKIKIAVARCARISYTTLGDNPKIDYEADIELHDRLLKSGHWSPFEHCARAMTIDEYFEFAKGRMLEIDHGDYYNLAQDIDKKTEGWCRNFRGFIQYRHLIEEE